MVLYIFMPRLMKSEASVRRSKSKGCLSSESFGESIPTQFVNFEVIPSAIESVRLQYTTEKELLQRYISCIWVGHYAVIMGIRVDSIV